MITNVFATLHFAARISSTPDPDPTNFSFLQPLSRIPRENPGYLITSLEITMFLYGSSMATSSVFSEQVLQTAPWLGVTQSTLAVIFTSVRTKHVENASVFSIAMVTEVRRQWRHARRATCSHSSHSPTQHAGVIYLLSAGRIQSVLNKRTRQIKKKRKAKFSEIFWR